MFPQLTDDQVKEYQTRVTTSAGEAGWKHQTSLHPLCHLRFHRWTLANRRVLTTQCKPTPPLSLQYKCLLYVNSFQMKFSFFAYKYILNIKEKACIRQTHGSVKSIVIFFYCFTRWSIDWKKSQMKLWSSMLGGVMPALGGSAGSSVEEERRQQREIFKHMYGKFKFYCKKYCND